MKKNFSTALLFGAIALFSFSCQEKEIVVTPETANEISFTSSISTTSKATDTAFEDGDQIGVTAFTASDYASVYADNVTYTFSKATEVFLSESPISYPENLEGLAFRAVYPALSGTYADEFSFSVLADQTTAENYTLSDLMIASLPLTSSLNPELSFSHTLSRIIVSVTSDVDLTGAVVKFTNVLGEVNVNLTEDTFEGTGSTGEIILASNGENTYKGILAPQFITMDTPFISIEVAGKVYTAILEADATLRSGKQYVYELILEDGGLTFDSQINPWTDDEFYVQYVEFNDDILESDIVERYDADGDGKISMAEAATVTEINLDNVSSATGIECFVNLETLILVNTSVQSIDLSNCTELTTLELDCSDLPNVGFRGIDFTANTKLQSLTIKDCEFDANNFSISTLTELRELTLVASNISANATSIDFTNHPKLTSVYTSSVELASSLDFSKCTELVTLGIVGAANSFSVNLANCTEITSIDFNRSDFTALDFSSQTKLESLILTSSADLVDINLSACTALKTISARQAGLTSIDLSKNVNLTSADVAQMYMTELDVRECAALATLKCGIQRDSSNSVIDMTLTLTQEQYDAGIFNDADGANANVIVNIQEAEESGDDSGAVITTTLAELPTDGSVGAGVWVITDETASSSDSFDNLRTALKSAGGEVTLEFPNLITFPSSAIGEGSVAASYLVNLVAVYAPVATKLNTDSFSYAANLHTIYCPAATYVDAYPFYNCSSLANLTLCTSSAAVFMSPNMLGGVTNPTTTLTLTTGSEEVTGLSIKQNDGGTWSWYVTSANALVFKEIIVVE